MKIGVLLLIMHSAVLAQITFDLPKEEKKSDVLSVSLQAAVGYINPERVNWYIDQDIEDRLGGGFIYEIGSSDINVAASLNLSLDFKIGEYFKIRAPLEYGGASKNVHVGDDFIRYTMNRFSTGAIGYYYHEVGEDIAVFGGGGALWHSMSFDKRKANELGPRIELGISWQGRKLDREFFVLFDSARGITGEGLSPYDINFTGIYSGIRFSF